MSWQATVLTIFPEMLPGPLAHSLAGKALAAGLWALEAIDIRAHATDKHRSVDDTPAGGPVAGGRPGKFGVSPSGSPSAATPATRIPGRTASQSICVS